LSVLGLAATTLLAVRLSAAAGQVPGTLPDLTRDALRNGIPRLLTAMIPIEPQPDTVVVPVIATWLAGLAAAELGLRYQRVLLACAPPALLLGGALYLVGPNARPAVSLPLAFAGFAAVGLAASTGDAAEPTLTKAQRTTLGVRVGAGAAAGLTLIVALTGAVGPSVAGQVGNTPTDPRRYVTPPRLDSLDESPLARLSGWGINRDQHLFDANLTWVGDKPGPANARIRLAVLSDFDGVTWRVGGTYRYAGRELTGPPAEASGDRDGPQLVQQITIDGLDGRLLPGAATPERIDGVRIAYDEATGTMALPDGLRAGTAYTVVSRQPKLEVNLLPSADAPTGDAVARFTALPGKVPEDITKLAQQLGSGVSSAYQRAVAVEEFLAEHYTQVQDAPTGHAYPNLGFFLFGPRHAGGQRGTTEQFSAAFAVLTRALGLPTRIVVGFEVKTGANVVRGANAVAWPEVLFAGLGWVAFDPRPLPNTQAKPVEEDFRPKPDPTNPPPTVVPTPSASVAAQPSPSAPPPAGPERQPPIVAVALVSGGVATTGLIGLLVAIPVLRQRLRRRRLDDAAPAARISGAWLELLDGLRMAGRPALPQLTATEVARYAAAAAGPRAHAAKRPVARPPAPPIDELARLANAVAFSTPAAEADARRAVAFGAPAAGAEADARRAVAQAVAYVDELRARRPWWRRVLWALDPRPLRWERGRRRA
jgi:transglutaminase-like putative cysteine protease